MLNLRTVMKGASLFPAAEGEGAEDGFWRWLDAGPSLS